jgi:serine/threonine protein kinase
LKRSDGGLYSIRGFQSRDKDLVRLLVEMTSREPAKRPSAASVLGRPFIRKQMTPPQLNIDAAQDAPDRSVARCPLRRGEPPAAIGADTVPTTSNTIAAAAAEETGKTSAAAEETGKTTAVAEETGNTSAATAEDTAP